MRLSHSALTKYTTCNYQWKLHYHDKIRSERTSSALVFGGALDNALNCLLLSKKKVLSDSDKLLIHSTPEKVFENSMTNVFINDIAVDLRQSVMIDYFKSDCDDTLLTNDDRLDVVRIAEGLDITISENEISSFVTSYQGIKNPTNQDEKALYNAICWKSLYRKGLLLLDHYRSVILPQIDEVFEVQKEITLKDGDDEFVGVIDLIASFKDEPEIKYIIDNKTASKAYPDDAVRTSNQLAIYCEHEGLRKASFIVLEKTLRKKAPKVRSQILRDNMSEEQSDRTFDQITETFYDIKAEKFDKNFDACFQYGRRCIYYDYCRSERVDGLVKLGEK